MDKTLIVLGAGIWGVMITLRFFPFSTEPLTNQLFNVIEIVAFIITVVGILKRG